MTSDQAYMIWKSMGRADPKDVPEFSKRRAGDQAQQKLDRVVAWLPPFVVIKMIMGFTD